MNDEESDVDMVGWVESALNWRMKMQLEFAKAQLPSSA